MAFEIPGRKITRVAGADLSALKHTFVVLDTDGTVIAASADTEKPYGILQNNPTAGGEAEIMKDGVSKLIAGEAVNIGEPIGMGATGRGMHYAYATATKFIVGTALSATTGAGQMMVVDFSCSSPGRGA